MDHSGHWPRSHFDDGFVRALYEDNGLPVFHMTLLLGVGLGAVMGALRMAGVELRGASEPAPWRAKHRDENFVRLCP